MKTELKREVAGFNFVIETGVAIKLRSPKVSTIHESGYYQYLDAMEIKDAFMCQNQHVKAMTYAINVLRHKKGKRYLSRRVPTDTGEFTNTTEMYVWRNDDLTPEEFKKINEKK